MRNKTRMRLSYLPEWNKLHLHGLWQNLITADLCLKKESTFLCVSHNGPSMWQANEMENSAVVSHFMKCIFDYNGISYRLRKKVCTKEAPLIFFAEMTNNYNEIYTYITGTTFTKFRLFFHKIFIINIIFPTLRETLYTGSENSLLKRRSSFRTLCCSLLSSKKPRPWRSSFREPKKDGIPKC